MTKASERLAAMKARQKKDTYVEPTIAPDHGSTFTFTRWYDTIVNDVVSDVSLGIKTIRAASDYYAEAVQDGQYYVVPLGNLSTLLQQHAGITFFYQGVLVDCQQARRWLEGRLISLEAAKHNYYMHSEEAKAAHGVLKTTEASKMAKGDPEIVDITSAVRLLAYHEHNLENLMQAFDNNKYMLNHIVTIRKENLEEVWVDPTKETTNA